MTAGEPVEEPTTTSSEQSRWGAETVSAAGLPLIEVQPRVRAPVAAVRLPAEVVELIDRPEFAVLSTLQPDGSAQLSVMWMGRDGDELVMATKGGRRKVRNIERDPRVTVLLYDRARPARYAEIRGTAQVTGEDAHALVDELARRYTGSPHVRGTDQDEAARVVLRITPDRVLFVG